MVTRKKTDASGTAKDRGKSAKRRLHIRPGKPVGPELRRIVIFQIEAALASLKGNNVSHDAVHDARTCIKKIRAILQLSCPAMSRKQRVLANRLLSEASQRLAPLRDSEVRVRMLDSLLERTGLHVDDYASLRTGLADVAKQRRINDARKIPAVLNALRRVRGAADSWPMEDLTGKDLKRRMRRTYRRGRTALALCSVSPDPDPFHLWRKQVKMLWYQLRITAPLWKGRGEDLICSTERIGQLAGDERDLGLLRETLIMGPKGKATSLLLAKIAILLPELRRQALDSGLAFYGIRPKQFVEYLDL